ncbi:hypothetical protein PsorP6_009764 [Peronosclerospora sorghi]|uniref:Uncharacterized protein n=1 Tax=Peronosclerospora sorghi TaxID=230839 RepID=A0ACC0VXZ5_9STRA|nr:hypothetical protein PsorP6_009764 [Peronosclerospora sorghi]
MDPAASGSIDPTVFAALPLEIQEEVLAQNTLTSVSIPPSVPGDAADVRTDAWSCHVCTFLNHFQLIECEMCGTFCLPPERDRATKFETAPDLGFLNATVGQTLRRLGGSSTSSFTTESHARDSLRDEAAAPPRFQFISWKRQRSSSTSALAEAAGPSVRAIHELTALQQALKQKVVAGHDAFEASLERLWRVVHAHDAEDHVFEKARVNWVAMGFQNANPETDFRGGGVLALKCLVYAFETHPIEMRAIQQAQAPASLDPHQPPKRWYPVCVAGINLTCLLAGLLQLGDSHFLATKQVFWPLFEDPAAFYELFFYAFLKMDAIWHRLNATYMEFGVVLKVTQKSVMFMLDQAPGTLMDLREARDQAFLDRFIVSLSAQSLAEWENGECPDPDHALEAEDALVLAKTRSTTPPATALTKGDALYPLH